MMNKIINKDANYEAFEARLKRHEFHWIDSDNSKLEGDFFYLPFKYGKPMTEEFLSYLVKSALYYSIPYNMRKDALEKSKANDFSEMQKIFKRVKNLFNNSATSGEFGEVILYLILQNFFDAPQIVCKMILKTASNMPVFGADALHVQFDEKNLILYHGESKMYNERNPKSAIEDSVESSKGFLLNEYVKDKKCEKKDFEIDLINTHFSLPDCSNEQKEMILNYFNPLKKESNYRKEIAVCLVGFNMKFYSKEYDESVVEEIFKEAYKNEIDKAVSYFKESIDNFKLEKYYFRFIVLPFESIKDFRKKFLEQLNES